MTKINHRSSRFYVEQDWLYETSDLSYPTQKKVRTKQTKALTAEKSSHQKIVAVNAPVTAIITDDDTDLPATDLRNSWIEQ